MMLFVSCNESEQKTAVKDSHGVVAWVEDHSISEKSFLDSALDESKTNRHVTANRYSDEALINRLVEDEILFQESRSEKLSERNPIKQMLVRSLFDSVKEAAAISDDEVKRYYDDHKEDYLELSLAQLFMAKDKKITGHADVKAFAETLVTQLKKGASFKDVTARYSDDKQTASKQGYLGYFSKNRMGVEVWAKLIQVKPGGYSDVFETSKGYHIVKVIDKRYVDLDKASGTIRVTLARDIIKKKEADLLTTLRNENSAKIDAKLLATCI